MNYQSPTRMVGPPAITYQGLLERDPRPTPAVFDEATRDLGTEPISARRYTSPDFFKLEVEKMWMRTWQYACREEDIAETGDTYLYELLDQSAMVVRQRDGSVRAFKNVCRHRGRKLVSSGGCKTRFRCPYHGLTWRIDGSLEENPFAWDFPQIEADDIPLLTVRCETWAGFVFLNFDPDAAPLLEQLAPMPEHFDYWKIDQCYRAAHVGKLINANWKVCAEAFIEGHHVICTHPEYNLYSGYDSGQHDVLSDHVTRFMSPIGLTPGPFLDRNLDDAARLELMLSSGNRSFKSDTKIELGEGMTARGFIADTVRSSIEERTGHDLSFAIEADLIDGLAYDFFPNFHLWGGFKDKISYRFRPIDHENTLMEVMLFRLAPKDGERPASAKLRMLGEDETWGDAEELGPLGPVYNQDLSNMGPMQQGLRTLGDEPIHFSKYLEVRCRNLHRMIDEYIAR